MAEVPALGLLAAAAWAIGSALLRPLPWPELRRFERASLELTAGLGIAGLLLSIASLAGWFSQATAILVALAAAGAAARALPARLKGSRSSDTKGSRFLLTSETLIIVCAVVACLGAIAPVTDYDALSYVLPIARHIANEGTLRVWTDQGASIWPQAHQVLLAFLVTSGASRLGAVSAIEWLMAVGAIAALARRVCIRTEHVPLAVAIAIAAPVTAFQVAGAKEDLIMLAATAAALFCLAGPTSAGEAAGAGLFAGVAASMKYPGLGVAIAVVAWIAIAHRGRRLRHMAAAAAPAALVAGIWYGLNAYRFGNPIAPFVFGARGTALDAESVRTMLDAYGGGRCLLNAIVTPLRIFAESDLYGGRALLFHPLCYAGLAALAIAPLRARSAPLIFTAAVLYAGWYLTLQNARLLLPAAVALAPAAADVLASAVKRSRWLAAALIAAIAPPLLLVAAVGVVRAVRYRSDPATYLERESEHYADIQWMNAHLDPTRHRVVSMFGGFGYLAMPAIGVAPLRQLEFHPSDLASHDRFLAACRRQGVTHLFDVAGEFADVAPQLRVVYENPASRLGDVHFFRAAPIEATAVYEILR